MFSTLVENFKLIGILMAMYLGSFGVNVLLGLYSNIAEAKQSFSKEKFLQGLLRGLIAGIGCFVVTAIISLLPNLVAALGITVEDGALEGISITAMSGVILSLIFRYIKDALTKFYTILYGDIEVSEDASETTAEEQVKGE
jgi:hypothetical protein